MNLKDEDMLDALEMGAAMLFYLISIFADCAVESKAADIAVLTILDVVFCHKGLFVLP